jgi:SAM-dependent methyltransferase
LPSVGSNRAAFKVPEGPKAGSAKPPSEEGKRAGVVYTPAVLVGHIVRQTLEDWLDANRRPPRIFDPACGEGAFLVEAYRRLLRQPTEAASQAPRRIALLRECVFGIDTDHSAVEIARQRLREIILESGSADETELDEILSANLRCEDALAGGPLRQAGTFDVVVANPPFIGARRLARRGSIGESFADAYATVQGSCDLYVVFLERICELLAEGGRFGVIVPNRVAVADYANRCRELLLSQTRLERIEDVSGLDAFPSAAVYPVILYGVKEAPQPQHRIAVVRPESLEKLDQGRCWFVAQGDVDPQRGLPLRPDLDVESRVPTRPLGELAALHSGTTGFVASRMAGELVERDGSTRHAWDFITTGNIDRYRIRTGNVRFLGRTYRRPMLPSEAPLLTEQKRRLYREPKIVLAGLSRRPEAAWSAGALALGVQVYAAADFREDPFYLLAILNSKLFAYLFRARFCGRRMSGGYLAMTKSQLARLPIRSASRDALSRRMRDDISTAAACLTERMAVTGERVESDPAVATLEQRIDLLVNELYELDDDVVAMIESEVNPLV